MPVVLRSLVPTDTHGGTFDGTLIGGNGREFVAQTDTFQFDVPKGRKALSVSLSWPDNAGTEAIGWLIDPDGTLLGSKSSIYVDAEHGRPTRTHGLEAFALSPQPGRWKFVITVTTPVGGTVLSSPYHGVVSFDPPQIQATGLPDGDKVQAGQPVTATVTVTNTGPGTMDVFADPRLADRYETDSLFAALEPCGRAARHGRAELPGPDPDRRGARRRVRAPRRSCSRWATASSARAIRTCIGVSQGNNAAASYSGPPELSNGTWFLAPALRGPFDAAGLRVGDRSGCSRTRRRSTATPDSTTGDFWRVADRRQRARLHAAAAGAGSVRDDHGHVHAAGQEGRQGQAASCTSTTSACAPSPGTSRSRSRTATRSSRADRVRAAPPGPRGRPPERVWLAVRRSTAPRATIWP